MKLIATILTIITLVQFAFLPAPAFAEPIHFTGATPESPASVQGQVPINKIGALLAVDALAILNGNEIRIESKEKAPNAPENDLLSGVLLNSRLEGADNNANVVGTAYFTGGKLFERLRKRRCVDKITLADGKTISGNLTSVTASGCTMETTSGVENVKASDIEDLHSAHAFKFTVPVNTSPETTMKMTPTCLVLVGGATKSSKVKRIMIVMTTVVLVATAIAVPIAVAVGTHHSHHSTVIPLTIVQRPTTPPVQMRMPTNIPTRITVPTKTTYTTTTKTTSGKGGGNNNNNFGR